MSSLEAATIDELWAEIRSRCDAAVLAYILPAHKVGDDQAMITHYGGGIAVCVGLCEISKARLMFPKEDSIDE